MRLYWNLLVISMAAFLTNCASAGKYSSPQEWVAESKKGGNLILAEKADVWSEAKKYNPGAPNEIDVKTLFVKHFGTTCVYDVEYTNNGKSAFNENTTLVRPDQEGQYHHNTTRIKLNPGESVVVKAMEVRECGLHWGESKDPNICASCGPRLGFMK